jgi:signal transduction histidine kinase
MDVLNKVADLRLPVHMAENASRGFVFTGDRSLAKEFRDSNIQIQSVLPELKEAVGDNAGQTRLIEGIETALGRPWKAPRIRINKTPPILVPSSRRPLNRDRLDLTVSSRRFGFEPVQAGRDLFHRRAALGIRPTDSRKPIHVMVSGRPLRNAEGDISGASIVLRDITEAQGTDRKLQQAQKLNAIGKLTGGVAHDFNNMLTVITGMMEVLTDDIRSNPEALQTVALVNQAADRCTELIQHLLAFACKQPLRPRNVDINSTVRDIAKLLGPTLGEHIKIDSMLAQEVAITHADSLQLANSLVNMAINARDAVPHGGRLSIESRNVVLDEAYAQANVGVIPGSYVMLAVSDTGKGMPAAILDKVFEPFFNQRGRQGFSGSAWSTVSSTCRAGTSRSPARKATHHDPPSSALRQHHRRRGRPAGRACRKRQRNHPRGRRRSAGARLRRRSTAKSRLHDDRGRGRTESAGPRRPRHGFRPVVHRRDHARRHEWLRIVGSRREAASGDHGSLHVRLYR